MIEPTELSTCHTEKKSKSRRQSLHAGILLIGAANCPTDSMTFVPQGKLLCSNVRVIARVLLNPVRKHFISN